MSGGGAEESETRIKNEYLKLNSVKKYIEDIVLKEFEDGILWMMMKG